MILDRRNVLLSSAGAAFAYRNGGVKDDPLYQKSLIIDGNLVASSLFEEKIVSSAKASQIRESGLTALKQTIGDDGDNFAETQRQVNDLKAAIARNDSLFMQVYKPSDIEKAKASHRIGVIFSFEAASMLEGKPKSVEYFAREGVRVMGLSYNKGSSFGGGSLQGPEAGLTSLGRQALSIMVEQGVTVDISHSNEATGFAAIAAAKVPVLITHAGSAAVHSHPRNKSDKMLRAVAESGGVVGIYDLSYLGGYPAYPTLGIYMQHLVHALAVCGEDHVGIGSDTFLLGVDTSAASMIEAGRIETVRRKAGIAAPEELPLPYVVGLNGPGRWKVICDALLQRGYGGRAIAKVLGGNLSRVFSETWLRAELA